MDLDDLRARHDLVSIIEADPRVQLHRVSGNRWEGLCPFHDDRSPSLSVWEDRHWWCFAGCTNGRPGDVILWVQMTEHLSFGEAVKALRERAGAYRAWKGAATKQRREPTLPPLIDPEPVRRYHEALLGLPKLVERIWDARRWSLEVLRACLIGWDGERLTIPIPLPGKTPQDACVDLRRYLPGGDPKMLPASKGRGAWPYVPFVIPDGATLIVTEGEPDCLAALSCGLLAVTNTCGVAHAAGAWRRSNLLLAAAKRILIVFDAQHIRETPGQQRAYEQVEKAKKDCEGIFGARAQVVQIPAPDKDITDVILRQGQGGLVRLLQEPRELP